MCFYMWYIADITYYYLLASYTVILQNACSSTTEASFDPFKSSVFRSAPQPGRTESETDKRLAELQRKREAIQGDISDVDRCTEVIFPRSENVHIRDVGYEEDDRADRKAVASSLKSKLVNFGKEDEAPLTTQAIRDMQKASKERVYNRTLLRVRFPDKVSIQGYFHPKDMISGVYTWIDSLLVEPYGRPVSCSSGAPCGFELYTTPPRNVLCSEPGDDDQTLEDGKLVPAATINIKFSLPLPEPMIVGVYLKDRTGADGGSTSAPLAFPVGASLVAQQKEPSNSKGTSESKAKSGTSGESKAGAPKWLKL